MFINGFLEIYKQKGRKQMDLNWSLKELYESFSGEAFQGDLTKLDTYIKEMNKLATEMTENHEDEQKKLEAYIALAEKISLTFEKLGVFSELTVKMRKVINTLILLTKNKVIWQKQKLKLANGLVKSKILMPLLITLPFYNLLDFSFKK